MSTFDQRELAFVEGEILNLLQHGPALERHDFLCYARQFLWPDQPEIIDLIDAAYPLESEK